MKRNIRRILLLMVMCALALHSLWAQEQQVEGRFRVTLMGFTVNHETWDNASQADGKRDETYITADVKVVDKSGNTLFSTTHRTKIIGDTNGFPDRDQGGSASSLGGLRTGDSHSMRMVLLEKDLIQGQHGVLVMPAIMEWDGGPDILNDYDELLLTHAPTVVGAIVTYIYGPAQGGAVKTALEIGLPPVFSFASRILGQAMDRPIGMVAQGNGYGFNPQSLVLTYETADQVARTDFGFGPGVIAINYKDDARLAGDYTLYLQVERIQPSSPESNTPREVSFRSSNGQYVVAEGGGGGVVNANRISIGPWEKLKVTDLNGGSLQSGDYIYLQAHNGMFLVAEDAGGREVNANRNAPAEWERFRISKVIQRVLGSLDPYVVVSGEIRSGDLIALQAYNGDYLVAEDGGGRELNANRTAIGPWETFIIVY